MQYLMGLFAVVVLVFGGLFLIADVQENLNTRIRLETSQEYQRAQNMAFLETTRANNNALATKAFSHQIQTFALATGAMSSAALTWAAFAFASLSVVVIALVLLNRQ